MSTVTNTQTTSRRHRPISQNLARTINRKFRPDSIGEKTDLEVLSMLVGARQASVILEEFGSIKKLSDYGSEKGFGTVAYMPYCAWGTVARLEAWLELSGRAVN
jgi:hypothetical protein